MSVPDADHEAHRSPRSRLGAMKSALRANARAARVAVRGWIGEDRVVAWAVLAWMLVQLSVVSWDLPGAWSWENDAIAPRDIYVGVAFNLAPGQAFRYPLLHHLLLALACAPWLLIAVIWALATRGFDGAGVLEVVLQTPTMTACAITAKLATLAMAGLALIVLARLTRRLWSAEAGRWAALAAMTCLSCCYYGRTTNLDMPYLMWTLLAIDRLVSVVEHGELRDYRLFGVFVGAAVATKDQAYASFVLVVPALLLLLPALAPAALAAGRAHWRRLAAGVGAGALSLGLLGGGLLNPSGFIARVRLLTGPNSQDWRTYESSAAGLWAQLQDLAAHQAEYWWPWAVVALAWLGVVVALVPAGPKTRLMRAIPLLSGLGFVLGFTLVVGRDEARFLLPTGMFLACYVGVILAAAVRHLGMVGRVLGAGLMVWAGLNALQLHLVQWRDARREVAAYLDTLPPGSVVETYGLTVAQPHFDVSEDSPYSCRRVGPDPPAERNPLTGCEELEGAWEDALDRRPSVIVLTHWTSRFTAVDQGARHTSVAMQVERDAAARFFRAALADELPGYREVLDARSEPPAWARALGARRLTIHGSAGVRVRVLRRVDELEP